MHKYAAEIERTKLVVLNLLDQDIENDSLRRLVKGGKRLRAILVGLLTGWNNPDFILAVEYLHKSQEAKEGSLVVLAHSHISAGYRRILGHYSTDQHLKLRELLDQELEFLLGMEGLCKYRLLGDLHLEDQPARKQKDIILDQVRSRTGSLFSLSFLLSWLSVGGHTEYIHNIKDLGYEFGLCYSISFGNPEIYKYFSRNEIIDLFVETNRRMMEGCRTYNLMGLRPLNMYLLDKFNESLK